MPRLPSPKMEWARFNLRVWREESDKFRLLSPDDRRLAAALYLVASAEGSIVDSPMALCLAAWENDTTRFDEIRSKMPAFGFVLAEGKWAEKNALTVYNRARHISLTNAESGSKGGKAKAEANAVADATANALAVTSPSLSVSTREEPSSSSVVEEPITYREGEQMALAVFEPVIEAEVLKPATPRVNKGFDLARLYLRARFERLRRDDSPYIEPPKGTIGKVGSMIDRALKADKDAQLLVSLPALVESDKIDAMLANPFTLLEDGSKPRIAQGGHTVAATDHAAVIGAKLQGLVIGQRQADILRLVGALEWASAQGVRFKRGA